jgi:hypothetical protein
VAVGPKRLYEAKSFLNSLVEVVCCLPKSMDLAVGLTVPGALSSPSSTVGCLVAVDSMGLLVL